MLIAALHIASGCFPEDMLPLTQAVDKEREVMIVSARDAEPAADAVFNPDEQLLPVLVTMILDLDPFQKAQNSYPPQRNEEISELGWNGLGDWAEGAGLFGIPPDSVLA